MATGSVIKRGKDSWLLQVYAGANWRGEYKPHTKTVHGTKAEAKRQLAIFYGEVMEGKTASAGKMTVEELAEEYIEQSAKRQMKTSSLNSVKSAVKIWIKPYLGGKKLNHMKKIDIQKWVNAMSDGIDGRKGVKPKTVKNIFSILSGMFEYAIDMDYITTNPCRGVRLPRAEKPEMEAYTPDEVRSMVDALQHLPERELRYKVAVQLGLWGGFRKQEICGFNRDDVDFNNNTIEVARTRLIGVGEGVYEDTTKTKSSMRIVALPEETMEDIRSLILQQERDKEMLQNHYDDSKNALLRKDTGEPIYPQVLQRWFKRFCDKTGIKSRGLHALRHTHASMLSEIPGIDGVTIQLRMGHSNLSTTMNVYTHKFNNHDTVVARHISDSFYRKEVETADGNKRS